MDIGRKTLVMRVLGFTPFVVCLLGVAAPAVAQAPRPERPYRGLFASGVGDAEQSLLANVSFGGGYDDNVLMDLPGAGGVDPRNAKSGGVGSLDGSLSYSVGTARSSFGSSIGSLVRYYPGQSEPYVTAYNGNVGGSVKVGRRTTLTGSQAVIYQPYTLTSMFASLVDPTLGQLSDIRIDQATSRAEYWSYNTTAGLGYAFSPRVSFSSNYNYLRSDTAFGTNGKFSRQGGYAGFGINMSRGLALRLGYGVQEGRFASGGGAVVNHNLDIGLDFSRALSFSRRTTVSFGSGTVVVNNAGNTSYRATGSARLNHEIGRTWNAAAGFSRSVQFVDLLLQPILADSIDGGVTGLLNRRVQFQSGIRASIGSIGFGAQSANSDFDTFQGTAGLSVALNRFIQLGTTYSFFRYRFDEGAVLPVGVARNIDRQSIRANVSLWAPLVNKARR